VASAAWRLYQRKWRRKPRIQPSWYPASNLKCGAAGGNKSQPGENLGGLANAGIRNICGGNGNVAAGWLFWLKMAEATIMAASWRKHQCGENG
jgi:hypothetical protein